MVPSVDDLLLLPQRPWTGWRRSPGTCFNVFLIVSVNTNCNERDESRYKLKNIYIQYASNYASVNEHGTSLHGGRECFRLLIHFDHVISDFYIQEVLPQWLLTSLRFFQIFLADITRNFLYVLKRRISETVAVNSTAHRKSNCIFYSQSIVVRSKFPENRDSCFHFQLPLCLTLQFNFTKTEVRGISWKQKKIESNHWRGKGKKKEEISKRR